MQDSHKSRSSYRYRRYGITRCTYGRGTYELVHRHACPCTSHSARAQRFPPATARDARTICAHVRVRATRTLLDRRWPASEGGAAKICTSWRGPSVHWGSALAPEHFENSHCSSFSDTGAVTGFVVANRTFADTSSIAAIEAYCCGAITDVGAAGSVLDRFISLKVDDQDGCRGAHLVEGQ